LDNFKGVVDMVAELLDKLDIWALEPVEIGVFDFLVILALIFMLGCMFSETINGRKEEK